MIRTQIAKVSALAALAAVALTACGGATESTSAPVASATSASSAAAATELACPPGKLAAEGSSAQKNAIEEAINQYADQCKQAATIEYNATGSGAGVKQFLAGLADFAGSDSALKTEVAAGATQNEVDLAKARCNANEAWNLPMVVGPIAFAYNVAGVDKLVLTPAVLSQIFTGKVTAWNDPAIGALNSGVSLPATKISVFFRSDDSGTTDNVSKYLGATAKDVWTFPHSKTWAPKGVGEGKNGSAGVAGAVKAQDGGIGYMEWSFARDNKLGIAQLDNGGGAVELTAEHVAGAVALAKIAGTGNDLTLKIDYTVKDPKAYPALLVTYEIVCSAGLDAAKAAIVKDFLGFFASSEMQDSLVDIGYAPLPKDLQDKVLGAIAAIK